MSGLVELFHQTLKEEVTCATFSEDLEILVLGFENGIVSIYNIKKKRHVTDLAPSHSACITALAISPNSKWISVGRATGSLANFLTRTAYLEQVVLGHKNLLHAVQFSTDSALLLSASACGLCLLYSLDEERPLWQLALPLPCLSCSISFDNRVIAAGVKDGSVHTYMWQPADLELHQRHLSQCRDVVRRLKSRAVFRVAQRLPGGQTLLTYVAHASPVTALAFARRSRLLATGGSHDRTVTVANWDRLEQLAVLSGHESWITVLRWGRDDLCLLSSAEHDSVKLWGRSGDGQSSEFSTTAAASVTMETIYSAMYCGVESVGNFSVVGCVDMSEAAAAAHSGAEFQLDERDFTLETPDKDEDSDDYTESTVACGSDSSID